MRALDRVSVLNLALVIAHCNPLIFNGAQK